MVDHIQRFEELLCGLGLGDRVLAGKEISVCTNDGSCFKSLITGVTAFRFWNGIFVNTAKTVIVGPTSDEESSKIGQMIVECVCITSDEAFLKLENNDEIRIPVRHWKISD
jgi:hypothetical protein